VDLSAISVKAILLSLQDRFGVEDLSDRRPLVKAVAQEYIQEHQEEVERAVREQAAAAAAPAAAEPEPAPAPKPAAAASPAAAEEGEGEEAAAAGGDE